MEIDELEKLYKRFISDRNVNTLELSLNRPNIFRALRLGHFEIRHSNFLAWLLDPNENHGLNDLFLKIFLREIFSSSKSNMSLIDIEEMNIDLTTVRREYLNIDILIELEKAVL